MNPQEQIMTYPGRLLPQPHFKKITWHESLRHQFLIHYTDTNDLVDPVTNKLKPSLVVKRTDHLRDYSNNLLGVFVTDDIFWSIQQSDEKEYFIAEWEVGETVIPPEVPSECKKDENRGYFFLSVNNCQEAIIPYQDDTSTETICMLLHTPTNSNFWHFSLRWFCDGLDIIDWKDNGKKRRILTAAKAFIIEKAFFEEPFFEELPSSLYCS